MPKKMSFLIQKGIFFSVLTANSYLENKENTFIYYNTTNIIGFQ